MAKYNNNYNYGNREQRRQQQRKQNQNTNKYDVYKNGDDYRVIEQSDDSNDVFYLSYNDVDYEIDNGYLTFLSIMEIQDQKDKRIRKEKLERSKGIVPDDPYTAKDEILDFNKILKMCFAEGEYDRFMKDNKRISISEIKRVTEAIISLIANGKVGAVEDQSNFRNKDK
jgi:hypothetical protein